MSRRKIAAANWKMNTDIDDGLLLIENLLTHTLDQSAELIICAPFTHLYSAYAQIVGLDNVYLGAQNLSEHDSGAYTGEISASMLMSVGVSHVIIGHSERREHFNESDELLGLKLRKAIDQGLIPIFCCGEHLEIRKKGIHIEHVLNQLEVSFTGYNASDLETLVIAYEPIWAIGTGETASPEQAQEMHAAIRHFLAKRFNTILANKIPILYGGSVKPNNAADLFGKPDVDGGLVGGASLDAAGFATIVNSFPK
jgi:triosephosphate isomerase (TIM)